MKVAVCISGFLRTWEQSKESFRQFFTDVDVDIYAQVYRQNYYEHSAKKKDITYTDEEIRKFFSGLNVIDLIIEDAVEMREKNRPLCEKYKGVKNYDIPIKESSDPNSKTVHLGERIYDQLRVVQVSADAMRKSEKRYDVVVKTRYDVLYLSAPNWQSLTDGKVHFEIGACGGYPNEIVVGGTPTAVVPILDRFALLDLLFSGVPVQGKGKCSCGEVIPCCGMCSHATFRHLLDYYKIEIGDPICQAKVLRSERLIHIPFQGTTPFQK